MSEIFPSLSKDEYPADFSGFVGDLPEHSGSHGIMESRDISAKSYTFTT